MRIQTKKSDDVVKKAEPIAYVVIGLAFIFQRQFLARTIRGLLSTHILNI